MIRIDAAWLACAPIDMRAGVDRALAHVVAVFGSAQMHHAYLFTNARANRLKVLVHDGLGLWWATRRLHQGRFHRLTTEAPHLKLTPEELGALVLGLPWQQLSAHSTLRTY